MLIQARENGEKLSDGIKKDIELEMQLLEELYDEVYEKCIDTSSKETIQQKADRFNEQNRKFVEKILPKEVVKDLELRTRLKHIPICNGEFNKATTIWDKHQSKTNLGITEKNVDNVNTSSSNIRTNGTIQQRADEFNQVIRNGQEKQNAIVLTAKKRVEEEEKKIREALKEKLQSTATKEETPKDKKKGLGER